MFSDNNGATFRGKRVFDDTSPHGPALVSHAGRLLLGWAGRVTRISTSQELRWSLMLLVDLPSGASRPTACWVPAAATVQLWQQTVDICPWAGTELPAR